MYAQFYAVSEANTLTANVSVTLDGKAKNVPYDTTNAKYQIATVMGTASTENVLASEDIRASFVEILTVLILLAPVTDSASKVPVYARKVGKVLTVRPWIRTRCNVCRTALDMARSTLILKPVLVMRGGLVMTVRKVYFIIT